MNETIACSPLNAPHKGGLLPLLPYTFVLLMFGCRLNGFPKERINAGTHQPVGECMVSTFPQSKLFIFIKYGWSLPRVSVLPKLPTQLLIANYRVLYIGDFQNWLYGKQRVLTL
jgi:hypothetical protein